MACTPETRAACRDYMVASDAAKEAAKENLGSSSKDIVTAEVPCKGSGCPVVVIEQARKDGYPHTPSNVRIN